MSTFEEKISQFYGWNLDLTKQIIFEYERFLQIKSIQNDVVPSEKINMCWEYHILNMEFYFNYSNTKFNKIIFI